MAASISIGHQFLRENDSSPFQLTEAGWAWTLDLVAEVWGILKGKVRLNY